MTTTIFQFFQDFSFENLKKNTENAIFLSIHKIKDENMNRSEKISD